MKTCEVTSPEKAIQFARISARKKMRECALDSKKIGRFRNGDWAKEMLGHAILWRKVDEQYVALKKMVKGGAL